MRSIEAIKHDIAIIKYAIQEANIYGDEREAELFYTDLEELYKELHLAKTATV